jgi:putative membrane protein
MGEFLIQYYDWLLAFHVISFISWMAGMLYLPRLFVYHAGADYASEVSNTFKIMEYRLLKIIMNPAMAGTWFFGVMMLWANPALLGEGWLHMKLTCVIAMSGLHGFFAKTVKTFAQDENKRPASFYRYMNEAPTILMVIVVIMVVVRPI